MSDLWLLGRLEWTWLPHVPQFSTPVQADGDQTAAGAVAGQEPDAAAREQALSETATGCYRLITARLAPTVQRWLRTLAKVRDDAPNGTAARTGVLCGFPGRSTCHDNAGVSGVLVQQWGASILLLSLKGPEQHSRCIRLLLNTDEVSLP